MQADTLEAARKRSYDMEAISAHVAKAAEAIKRVCNQDVVGDVACATFAEAALLAIDLPALLSAADELAALRGEIERAPRGEIRRVRFDEDERPTWHVVDDRDAVPLSEPKRVALVALLVQPQAGEESNA